MKVTPEKLAAFADGELEPAEAADMAGLIDGDPALAEEVRKHLSLKRRLSDHFDPITTQPIPEALADALPAQGAEILEFGSAARRKEDAPMPLRRWVWIVGPALAASLLLAVVLPQGAEPSVSADVARILDTQLSGTGVAADPAQVLLSFRDAEGNFCRAFKDRQHGGIACRTSSGWDLVYQGDASAVAETANYRMANSSNVMVRAQSMAIGPAMDAESERKAIGRNWHP